MRNAGGVFKVDIWKVVIVGLVFVVSWNAVFIPSRMLRGSTLNQEEGGLRKSDIADLISTVRGAGSRREDGVISSFFSQFQKDGVGLQNETLELLEQMIAKQFNLSRAQQEAIRPIRQSQLKHDRQEILKRMRYCYPLHERFPTVIPLTKSDLDTGYRETSDLKEETHTFHHWTRISI